MRTKQCLPYNFYALLFVHSSGSSVQGNQIYINISTLQQKKKLCWQRCKKKRKKTKTNQEVVLQVIKGTPKGAHVEAACLQHTDPFTAWGRWPYFTRQWNGDWPRNLIPRWWVKGTKALPFLVGTSQGTDEWVFIGFGWWLLFFWSMPHGAYLVLPKPNGHFSSFQLCVSCEQRGQPMKFTCSDLPTDHFSQLKSNMNIWYSSLQSFSLASFPGPVNSHPITLVV